MIHVGNDVVDLSAPQAQAKNLRYMKKVLTDEEIQIVVGSGNTHLLLWMFWAAKESAFKALSKSLPRITFAPKQYSVKMDPASNHGHVITPVGPVSLRVDMHESWVHCISATGETVSFDAVKRGVETIHPVILKDDRTRAAIESHAVRWAARKRLSKVLGLKVNEIDITRAVEPDGRIQPPGVRVRGGAAGIDISLSHDGRFVAYCFIARL